MGPRASGTTLTSPPAPAPSTPAPSASWTPSPACSPTPRTSRAWSSWPRRTRTWRPSSRRRSPPSIAPGRARGGAPVRRQVRRGRRAGHHQRGRGRHRRPDWRRWCCAWRCAGPSAAASRSSCSRPARVRRRASSRPPSVPRENATGCTRRRRACTGSCACRPSTPRTAARRRSRASRCSRWSRRRATSRSTTTTCRSPPTAPRARAASSQQDRLGGTHHAQAVRHGRAVPERALAVGQSRHRDGDAALQADRAGGAQAGRGDREGARRGAGRQLRLADPPTCCTRTRGQGPPDRLGGWQAPSGCSTATCGIVRAWLEANARAARASEHGQPDRARPRRGRGGRRRHDRGHGARRRAGARHDHAEGARRDLRP